MAKNVPPGVMPTAQRGNGFGQVRRKCSAAASETQRCCVLGPDDQSSPVML